MLTTDFINNSIPRLHPNDSVNKALQLMNDFRVEHLPVVSNEKYLGLVSENNLLEAEDETITLETLQESFLLQYVNENEHFLSAVSFSNQFDTSIVPVINEEKELTGVITTANLLKLLGNFSGADAIAGIIVLQMERHQFAISEISRIVESNDATILHLNTVIHPDTGILTVTLQLNKKEVASIVNTFERYEYNIVGYFGNEKFENDIHSNFRHLMNYLDI
ncbi:CBS domain-containing protein [Ferruginibacter albus]|uniref:CBS domain-containing protein n=1 Tax=Ferruginibacter albus TaxID=2875540 RepID=UPI001CC3921B|nr:CBS domain-containing protein [Ferruginibacter albus]UAY51834.1 CBS domain-containing protein [Ferruginibacter albus]